MTPQFEQRWRNLHSLPYGQPAGAKLKSRHVPAFFGLLADGLLTIGAFSERSSLARLPFSGAGGVLASLSPRAVVDTGFTSWSRSSLAARPPPLPGRKGHRLCWALAGRRCITMGLRSTMCGPRKLPSPPSSPTPAMIASLVLFGAASLQYEGEPPCAG